MTKKVLEVDQIIHGDSISILTELPPKSVDLIFADPPYNLQLRHELLRPNMTKVDAVNDEWDKFTSFIEYDEFTTQWLSACHRVLKDDGAIWVIGSYHNIFRVGKVMMDLGYWILNDIVWLKSNPMPNFRGVRFTNAHETLIWAKKSEKSRYYFNYHYMKQMNGGKQMRSDWEIPICSGSERILVNGEKAHPTQKPIELLRRVLLASSIPGSIVLDPFFGTGTTGVAAKQLNRHWIGIERDKDYYDVAKNRIALPTISKFVGEELSVKSKRDLPRVGIRKLIEAGYIKLGQKLFSVNREYHATVQPNGKILCNDFDGSIHEVSGKLLGKARFNGWEFWFYEDSLNTLVSIDALRQQYRKSELVLFKVS